MKFPASVVIALLTLGVFALSGWGTEESLKIGYVDVNEVFDAYDKAQGISKLVEAEKKKTRSEYGKREQEIRKANGELKEKASELSDEERGKRRNAIQQKIQELIKFERARKKQEQAPIGKALTEIYKAVETVGAKEGLDIIIEKRDGLFGRTVLYAKKSLSLTDKVIKELIK